ncbi:MAG TPA: hypothetical protein EYO58_08030 [Flavobacteriales bacterium]|nr:hypothetical protein [Flavobacteriales bacterium]
MILSFVSLFVVGFCAHAGNFPAYPPALLLYPESGERNSVQISCEQTGNPREILCHFYQMSVSYVLDPADLDGEIKKEIARYSGDEYTGEDILDQIKGMCRDSDKFIEAFEKKSESDDVPDRIATYVGLMRETCSLSTDEEVESFLKKMVRFQKTTESKTCKVWPNTWDETFSYNSTGDGSYWISKADPSGVCGIINVSTLRQVDEIFWGYDSRRVVTNREGSGSFMSLSCDSFEDRKVAYSWRPNDHYVMCEKIKFNF